jgi:DNA-binding response OmpR family regulator
MVSRSVGLTLKADSFEEFWITRTVVMTTVLLVEDSLTETQLLTHYLRQAGLTVISVTSGEEAHIKLQSQKPDLVILDVILPGQSGFELCRELKTNSSTQQIPVVICSTKGTEADRLWGSMLGADAYISKPVDQRKLMQTIQQLTAV